MNHLLIAINNSLSFNENQSSYTFSPPYYTYRTLRDHMLDGSFRRPYRLPSSSILLRGYLLSTNAIAQEERTPVKLPYYSGLGKGR
ncbi:hypothetical protein PRIPAC_82449 [Pristionchus pacificus]|uniref:Uncharacterized protein n=1 Tax=Pristionchus pacificus TaxID=54126 RepID=A0A2A6CP80_PRIPA|nr:hypothetical protein PRIPAC_82449 [Pristionchus pacificus]|eukprot:PDM79908.1 hypothetical protein PRIPAC_32487 [Pristionchus pacificus]